MRETGLRSAVLTILIVASARVPVVDALLARRTVPAVLPFLLATVARLISALLVVLSHVPVLFLKLPEAGIEKRLSGP